jgi:hypothetical protein
MAIVGVRHRLNLAGIAELFVSPRIQANMFLRGLLVESQAKVELSSNDPRRVDTGRLRADIHTRRVTVRNLRGARVSTDVSYGLYVHDGTGIYGPRHTPIKPKHGKVLVFIPKGETQPVFARSVRGMRPNQYLKNALPAARLR